MCHRRPNFSDINRMEHHAGIDAWLGTVSVCICSTSSVSPFETCKAAKRRQAAREIGFGGVQWRATPWRGASTARRREAGRRPAFVRSRRMDIVRRAPQPESLNVSMWEVK